MYFYQIKSRLSIILFGKTPTIIFTLLHISPSIKYAFHEVSYLFLQIEL